MRQDDRVASGHPLARRYDVPLWSHYDARRTMPKTKTKLANKKDQTRWEQQQVYERNNAIVPVSLRARTLPITIPPRFTDPYIQSESNIRMARYKKYQIRLCFH